MKEYLIHILCEHKHITCSATLVYVVLRIFSRMRSKMALQLVCFVCLHLYAGIVVEGVSDSDVSDIRIMLNETITGMASFIAETNSRFNAMNDMLQLRNRISISNGSIQKVCFSIYKNYSIFYRLMVLLFYFYSVTTFSDNQSE